MADQHPQPPIHQQTAASLPGAIAILSQAWSLYKQRLAIFLGVMIIPMLVQTGLLAVLAPGGFLGFSFLSPKFTAGGIGLLIILVIVFFLVFSINQAWGQTALLYAIKDSQEGIGVREAYRRGWHKILSYWWVLFLTDFIVLGGFLLFVVPGIIFAVWFSMAIFVLVAEDLKGMNALLKSREYVKGKWGGVFWRLFFIAALNVVISWTPTLIFNFLKVPIGREIGGFVIGLFLTPLSITYMYFVYSKLKAVKGEVAFAPTGRQKATFIIAGILGMLVIPVLLFLTLFMILLSSSSSSKNKALDVRREADLQAIQAGFELYYDENGKYPYSLNELSPRYILTIPVDPKTSFQYEYTGSDLTYKVCAQLENEKLNCVLSQH